MFRFFACKIKWISVYFGENRTFFILKARTGLGNSVPAFYEKGKKKCFVTNAEPEYPTGRSFAEKLRGKKAAAEQTAADVYSGSSGCNRGAAEDTSPFFGRTVYHYAAVNGAYP